MAKKKTLSNLNKLTVEKGQEITQKNLLYFLLIDGAFDTEYLAEAILKNLEYFNDPFYVTEKKQG